MFCQPFSFFKHLLILQFFIFFILLFNLHTYISQNILLIKNINHENGLQPYRQILSLSKHSLYFLLTLTSTLLALKYFHTIQFNNLFHVLLKHLTHLSIAIMLFQSSNSNIYLILIILGNLLHLKPSHFSSQYLLSTHSRFYH